MPSEFTIGKRTVEVQYRPLPEEDGQGRLMLLLTDVSQARELEQAVQTEARRLAFVVATVKNRAEFLDVMDDFHGFLVEVGREAQNGGGEVLQDAPRLMRLLHTYKGLFALMDCIHLPDALHEAEDRVADLEADAAPAAMAAAMDAERLALAARKDQDVIRETLGASFLENRGEVVLAAETTAELLHLAEELTPLVPPAAPETIARGLATLRRLRHTDLRAMLERYPRMALQLAERQDKELEPFAPEGDEALVDPQRLAPLVRSLVHVFRNAVDHGLEPREERQAMGKPAAGRMRCEVRNQTDGSLRLTISDDGRGLDLEALQAKAAELGLDANASSPDGIARLVFLQGVSTAPLSDVEAGAQGASISGRGVGMAAVLAETERLGGRVAVSSKKGEGVQFDFFIPGEPG